MISMNDYRQTAKDNEEIFRNILKDIQENKTQRPHASAMPKDFSIDESVDDIYKKYSTGNRYGIFTICDFQMTKDLAIIEIQDVAFLSGGGAEFKYAVKEDKSVKYTGTGHIYCS